MRLIICIISCVLFCISSNDIKYSVKPVSEIVNNQNTIQEGGIKTCVVVNNAREPYYIWFDVSGVEKSADRKENIRRSLFNPRNGMSIAQLLFDNINVPCPNPSGFYIKKLMPGNGCIIRYNKFQNLEIELYRNLFICSESEFIEYVGSIVNTQFFIPSNEITIEYKP